MKLDFQKIAKELPHEIEKLSQESKIIEPTQRKRTQFDIAMNPRAGAKPKTPTVPAATKPPAPKAPTIGSMDWIKGLKPGPLKPQEAQYLKKNPDVKKLYMSQVGKA
jgi:hypothetical protein